MVWPLIAAAAVSAASGAYGANSASSAQQASARDQANAARRNEIAGVQANEPLRYTGYQALNDINSFMGYQSAPYTTAQQLQATQTPLTAKQVMQYMRNGATFDQIAGMGTLGIGSNDGKFIKRLIKAGLTMDQITQLRSGAKTTPTGVAQPATAGGGGMNWDAIRNAPDYQFQLQQGTRDMGNSFAARGGAASGNALRALASFNQGLADQGVDKFINRRMNLVNGGTQATNNVTNISGNATTQLMNAQQQQGDARASGVLGTTGAIMGGLGSLAQIYGNYRAGQNQGYNGSTLSPYGPYAGGYKFPGSP